MNSEELEQSLKAEFESYLKGVLADMREDVKEFQTKIDAEFEKHRSQLDEAFQGFSSRFDADHEFDAAFRESVIEHLRLARDAFWIAAPPALQTASLQEHHRPYAGPIVDGVALDVRH